MVVLLIIQVHVQSYTFLIRWLYCAFSMSKSCLHVNRHMYTVFTLLSNIWIRCNLNLSPADPGTKAQRHAKLRMSKQCSDCWVSLYKICDGKKNKQQVILCLLFGAFSCTSSQYIHLREVGHGYKVDKYPWDVLSDLLQCPSQVSLVLTCC